MRQIDGLRTVAVAMVLTCHWYPKAQTPWFNGGVEKPINDLKTRFDYGLA